MPFVKATDTDISFFLSFANSLISQFPFNTSIKQTKSVKINKLSNEY